MGGLQPLQGSLTQALQVASFLEAHAPEVAAAPRWDGPDPPPVRVCVSLSGGVDSMVLALALARLGAGRWSVAGCHIDYGNRPESSAEAAFVQAWCEGQDIAFRLCTLPERLRRGLAGQGREAYEKESRDVRYNFYARSLAELGCAGMAVGHHRGDVQENVLTNLLKGASLLTVAGMSEVSRVNGVPVWCAEEGAVSARASQLLLGARRPLLPWDKAAIFAFAHRYGVPYFRRAGEAHRLVIPGAQPEPAGTPRPHGVPAANCAARCCRCSAMSLATVREDRGPGDPPLTR